ncbi:MAG TPA: radical SAM protein, partial [Candidatus Limnocylindria bacterium]|nr:radical SAM protein [Candidatus Limnocylindria bacterium]
MPIVSPGFAGRAGRLRDSVNIPQQRFLQIKKGPQTFFDKAKPLGLYLHFPFCQSKCAYCDFPSWAGELALREAYTDALVSEIRARAGETGRLSADTVYLGGGTPSLMEPAQMARVLAALRECFDVAPGAEISCEANPGTLAPAFLDALLQGGVNRLSLGAQSAHA